MSARIAEILMESGVMVGKFVQSKTVQATISHIAHEVVSILKNSGQVLICGNGGSAADAQHMAAEMTGTFRIKTRRPLPVFALTTNTSHITAVGNDFGFKDIFSRLIHAHCVSYQQETLLIAISTSGNSENIIEALKAAKTYGATTVGLTGQTGGKMKELCDFLIQVPSDDTPRIQECHLIAEHAICDLVEQAMFSEN